MLGISLGAHAAWHVILQDPRFTSAAIILGCPDYAGLMRHRAEKSRRKTWTASDPPGAKFVGSVDYPGALITAVREADPVGQLCEAHGWSAASVRENARDKGLWRERSKSQLSGKKIMCSSGGADKLVPYAVGAPFLKLLKAEAEDDEFGRKIGFRFDDWVYEGVGHQCTKEMEDDAIRWVVERVVEGTGDVADLAKPPGSAPKL